MYTSNKPIEHTCTHSANQQNTHVHIQQANRTYMYTLNKPTEHTSTHLASQQNMSHTHFSTPHFHIRINKSICISNKQTI